MTARLKLAAMPDETPVKLTLELPGSVHRDLLAYADALGESGGRVVDPAKLAPVMLARFMATDRAFARIKRQ